jgi:hypothetical protein
MMRIAPDNAKRQAARGLPGEPLLDRTLLYNSDARTLILSCSLIRNGVRFPQVYLRQLKAKKYASVATLAKQQLDWRGDVALESPFSCHGGLVVCHATLYNFAMAPVSVSGLGLLRIHLANTRIELWDTRDGAAVDWVLQELVGCNLRGSELYGVVGFPRARRTDKTGYTLRYALARLSWRSRRLEEIQELPNIFY